MRCSSSPPPPKPEADRVSGPSWSMNWRKVSKELLGLLTCPEASSKAFTKASPKAPTSVFERRSVCAFDTSEHEWTHCLFLPPPTPPPTFTAPETAQAQHWDRPWSGLEPDERVFCQPWSRVRTSGQCGTVTYNSDAAEANRQASCGKLQVERRSRKCMRYKTAAWEPDSKSDRVSTGERK